MTRKRYSREFKIEAVKLVVEQGLTITQASQDLGIHANMLSRWKQQYLEDNSSSFPGNGKLKPQDDELQRLRKEVARLREERDILKKAAAFFAKESK